MLLKARPLEYLGNGLETVELACTGEVIDIDTTECKIELYTVITLCRDVNVITNTVTQTYIDDGILKLYESKEEAFEAALNEAEMECESLNDGCDKHLSFGIPEDTEYDNKNTVNIMYYNDCDDVEELVTSRVVRKIVQ